MFAAGYKLASKTNEYTLFAFGDLHRDSESFDPRGLRKLVGRVKSCENKASVVHLGDSFEFMRKRNRDALLAALAQMTKESRLRIDDANKRAVYQLAAELDPIRDKILASVQGNHGWIFDDGRTSEKVLADELGFDWADGAANLNLVLNATGGNTIHTVQVWMSHGYGGGRTRSGDVRQFETAVIPFHEADIYLMGHCFDTETELLTPNGWVNGIDIKRQDIVATFNTKLEKFEWNQVEEVYKYNHYKEMVHIESKTVSMVVTPDHGLLTYFDKPKHPPLFEKADLFLSNKNINRWFINASKLDRPGINLSDDQIRMVIWVCADGSIHGKKVRFHLSKQRKIDKLHSMIEKMGLNSFDTKTKRGLRITVSVPWLPDCLYVKKQLPSFFRDANEEQAKIILEEYINTDGHRMTKNSAQIYSFKNGELDLIQEIMVTNGFRTTKSGHRLTVNSRPVTILTPKVHGKPISYNGEVWCVSVNNGTLLTRRNGKTVVAQNSHKLWTEPLDPKLGFTKGMNPQQTVKIRWGGRVGSFVRHYQVGIAATYAEERLFPPSLVGWLEFDIRFSRQGGEVRVPIIEGRAVIA